MHRLVWFPMLGFLACMAPMPDAAAQPPPYIGYVYPAGGRQGTTFQVRLGGQRLDGLHDVLVSGAGVSATVVEYRRQLGPQEMALLREQLRELEDGSRRQPDRDDAGEATDALVRRLQDRIAGFVQRPASAALASVALVQVTIATDAAPGVREIRLATRRGISNPLLFHVGQLPEVARTPMNTCPAQLLGKESLALRRRPKEEAEVRITLPCTANGQIAPGEVNRYRFEAFRGQHLVISVAARQLIPYIADAVPGWFQPVMTLYDADGREVAFSDDYRFQPDPTICLEVPHDGEYVVAIADALYRGREDFVYRMSIGELPFVTDVFPAGGRAGEPVSTALRGWNLEGTDLLMPPPDAEPGRYLIAARTQAGLLSNRIPFALDRLPECADLETNDDAAHAQAVQVPVIVNGRIDRRGDWDVFRVTGRAGETIVADVHARRLDSPLDSMLKLTDAAGQVLALNDDHEDPVSGTHTHQADSYLMFRLPADGVCFVHLGDATGNGGPEYVYRLRISAPQPDFALRVVPSAAALRSQAGGPLTVYAIRKDGFAGDIQVRLKDPPAGFRSPVVRLPATSEMVRLPVRTTLISTPEPVTLVVEGRAAIGGQEVVHDAVPAEDRMQAFLWRHLVPAQEFKMLVFDPAYEPPAARVPPPMTDEQKAALASEQPKEKAKFTEQQVRGRLRQLKALYEEWLLTDDFYNRKVAECEAVR